MDLDPTEWFQNQLRRGNEIEPQTLDAYRAILEPGYVYIDVGAHIGYQTLVARKSVGPSGMVIAIEPQPYSCARIVKNWSLNQFGNVIV